MSAFLRKRELGTSKRYRSWNRGTKIENKFNLLPDEKLFNIKMAAWKKRLQKELTELQKRPPPGMKLDTHSVVSSLSTWTISLEGAEGTLYEGEKYQLQFKFGPRYPFDSPEVIFTGSQIPVHPHVYSNGHICLSILTEDWSPALSVEAVCLSIISMLSSCSEKKRPPDNNIYVRTCHKNPKKTRWWYHDDEV